jgi:hypothetical protein
MRVYIRPASKKIQPLIFMSGGRSAPPFDIECQPPAISWQPSSFLARSGAGAAIADDTWPVDGNLQGKNGKKSNDVSGITCIAPDFLRACLIIDDNLQAAQFVSS